VNKGIRNSNCVEGNVERADYCIKPPGKKHNYGFNSLREAENACDQVAECAYIKHDVHLSGKFHLRSKADRQENTGPRDFWGNLLNREVVYLYEKRKN